MAAHAAAGDVFTGWFPLWGPISLRRALCLLFALQPELWVAPPQNGLQIHAGCVCVCACVCQTGILGCGCCFYCPALPPAPWFPGSGGSLSSVGVEPVVLAWAWRVLSYDLRQADKRPSWDTGSGEGESASLFRCSPGC